MVVNLRHYFLNNEHIVFYAYMDKRCIRKIWTLMGITRPPPPPNKKELQNKYKTIIVIQIILEFDLKNQIELEVHYTPTGLI